MARRCIGGNVNPRPPAPKVSSPPPAPPPPSNPPRGPINLPKQPPPSNPPRGPINLPKPPSGGGGGGGGGGKPPPSKQPSRPILPPIIDYAPRPDPNRTPALIPKPPSGDDQPASGGGGYGGYTYVPPPDPAPVLPSFTEDKTATFKGVKVAAKDTIVFKESDVNIELMQDLLFEDIAAIELANMSRYDLIDGQEVYYSPIKNLSTIKKRFDPNNIIATATNNKASYAIDLISRIGSGTYAGVTKGVPVLGQDEIYFYLDGLKEGEIVEIQLVSGGTIDEIGE